MNSPAFKRPRPPLDAQTLEQLALSYVGRYATTRARLRAYLARKLKERGWAGPGRPATDDLVERLAGLGYVDDAAFAAARAGALGRRGFGDFRVAAALRAAGIDEADAAPVREDARERALETALRFARRRRIGPYAEAAQDHDARRKAFAAMLRAGHAPDVVRRVLDASPGDLPDPEFT